MQRSFVAVVTTKTYRLLQNRPAAAAPQATMVEKPMAVPIRALTATVEESIPDGPDAVVRKPYLESENPNIRLAKAVKERLIMRFRLMNALESKAGEVLSNTKLLSAAAYTFKSLADTVDYKLSSFGFNSLSKEEAEDPNFVDRTIAEIQDLIAEPILSETLPRKIREASADYDDVKKDYDRRYEAVSKVIRGGLVQPKDLIDAMRSRNRWLFNREDIERDVTDLFDTAMTRQPVYPDTAAYVNEQLR